MCSVSCMLEAVCCKVSSRLRCIGNSSNPKDVPCHPKELNPNTTICWPIEHFPGSSFRFMAKHGDVELTSLLEDSAPPPDISRVSIFRTAIAKHEKQVGLRVEHWYRWSCQRYNIIYCNYAPEWLGGSNCSSCREECLAQTVVFIFVESWTTNGFQVRLHSKMAIATMQNTLAQVEEDLASMTAYVARAQEDANRQVRHWVWTDYLMHLFLVFRRFFEHRRNLKKVL